MSAATTYTAIIRWRGPDSAIQLETRHTGFRSPEEAALYANGTMVAAGHYRIMAILVVADRNRFTPCGACMDWVFQFGGDTCLVGFQQIDGGTVQVYTAGELMPHYPR